MSAVGSPATLGIGMVGYAFMGAAHSHAWRTAPAFFDLPIKPLRLLRLLLLLFLIPRP